MAEPQAPTSESPRQDLYSGRRIEWRWVAVGALIVLGLETLVGSSLHALGVGDSPTSFSLFFVSTTVAFLVGGGVIGMLSPGWTIWEAGFASAIAVVWTGFLLARLLDASLVSTMPLGLAWGVLCGLAGGWVGERLQHRG